ncbi:hypothetical protein SmJEL517_g02782 [Synchytrium microbalum]|uniref:Cyclin N-terminal domain-containing protein n=1 Tax=Synchytrium microbalum TaxID=1806994 RepID=A0A507CAY7_9FUNG|nr:uncharacterized protein SmJEL517_g02782 [Synchytrium microbalum]TPX34695.1 hypothetical protein SmJEL517_g02782 [Synchytrium microbalum]
MGPFSSNNSTELSSHAIHVSESIANRTIVVENLIDIATGLIDSCWPNQSISSKTKLVPLRRFLQEILRRSRTSFSTLQLALLYLVRLRNVLKSSSQTAQTQSPPPSSSTATTTTNVHSEIASALTGSQDKAPSPSICGRRMFFSALVVAAKYLQDRNYSNKAWSKIAGLSIAEVNTNEREFLTAIDYNLYVSHHTFATWSSALMVKATGSIKNSGNIVESREQVFQAPVSSSHSSINSTSSTSNGPTFTMMTINTSHTATPSYLPSPKEPSDTNTTTMSSSPITDELYSIAFTSPESPSASSIESSSPTQQSNKRRFDDDSRDTVSPSSYVSMMSIQPPTCRDLQLLDTRRSKRMRLEVSVV